MLTLLRALKLLSLALIGAGLILLGLGYAFVARSLPDYDEAFALPGLDRYRAAGGDVLDRVVEKIGDDAFKRPSRALYFGRRFGLFERDPLFVFDHQRRIIGDEMQNGRSQINAVLFAFLANRKSRRRQ